MAEAMASGEASLSGAGAAMQLPQAQGQAEEVPCARLASLTLEEKPTCVICLGMAGSGKTTFVQVRTRRLGYQWAGKPVCSDMARKCVLIWPCWPGNQSFQTGAW